MIPGYERKVSNRFGCWSCINASNGENAVLKCGKHHQKVSGCGICPDWEDMVLTIERKNSKED